ncbi:MAG: hypothetical protein V1689_06085 [Pseudomonadota bacterium]
MGKAVVCELGERKRFAESSGVVPPAAGHVVAYEQSSAGDPAR